jgi:hypothetical protein
VAVEKAERRGIKEAVELKKPKGRAIGCSDDRANSMRRRLSAPGKIHSDGGDLEFPPPGKNRQASLFTSAGHLWFATIF